jgi:hypothetical protein
MRSSLLASVDVMEFQTTEAYSNLDLTKVKYRIVYTNTIIIIIILFKDGYTVVERQGTQVYSFNGK